MPKNTRNSRRQSPSERSSRAASILFLYGCAAESYGIFVLRYFVNGTFRHVAAGSRCLPLWGWIGAAVCAAGAAGYLIARKWKRPLWRKISALIATGGGIFSLISFLGRYSPAALTVLSIAIPAATLLGILWLLYDRECALSLTALGFAVIITWACYRGFYSYPILIRIITGGFALILAAAAYLLYTEKLKRLLPPKTNPTPVYASFALAGIGMLATFLGRAPAYYAMWTLSFLTFGLVVYYTVKQL